MQTQERHVALEHLAASETKMLKLTESLTPEQWHFKESPDRWSIAENVEHCILIENGVLPNIRKALEAPADPGKRHAAEARRAASQTGPPPFQKLIAPGVFVPQGKFTDTAELVAALRAARAATVAFTTETDQDLHDHFMRHFVFGDLDCYEWVMLISHHLKRHARQIETIKANPAFPA